MNRLTAWTGMTLLLLAAFGCSRGKRLEVLQPVKFDEPEQGAGVELPIIPNPCNGTLTVSARLLTPQPIGVNQEVSIQVQAGLCGQNVFRIQNEPSLPPFSSTIEVKKRFGAPGLVGLSFVVEVLESAQNPTVLGVRSASVNFAVGGVGSSLCEVRRTPNTPISSIDAPLSVFLIASTPVLDAKINGMPVQLGTSVNVPTLLPGSGQYSVQGEVTTAKGVSACNLVVEVPQCEHKVLKVTSTRAGFIELQTSTKLKGQVSGLTVNGATVSPLPPPPQNEVPYTGEFALPLPNNQSTARVRSFVGDSTSCSVSYFDPQILEPLATERIDYIWFLGESPNGKDRIMSGAGIAAANTNLVVLYENSYKAEVLKANSVAVSRDRYCNPNEVMVGRTPSSVAQTSMNEILCQELREEVGIAAGSIVDKNLTWTYGATTRCPTGTILIGTDYLGSILRLRCAKLEVKKP